MTMTDLHEIDGRIGAAPSADPAAPHRATVASAPVDPVSLSDTVRTIMDWTESDVLHTAIGVNAAMCNLASTDDVFRALVSSADLAYADGQSVVWAARALGVPVPERVATTDLVYPLSESCCRAGKRMYLFGGVPGTAEATAARLRALDAGLEVRVHDGYVPEDRMHDVIDDINDFHTDVLLVGLGDPLQQRWVRRWRNELSVPAVLTCGGLFDWASGSRRRAPLFLQRAGMEWAWRLALEPRRLATRYILGNPAFVARVARQVLTEHRMAPVAP
jgi:N-acetylglucosaminyldiphosphoundecaprenol N-acetyl-beta-D-mannosaminyltransferase